MYTFRFKQSYQIAALPVLVALISHSSDAAAVTNLNSCTTISVPGSFKVSQNLSAPIASLTGNCVTVAADFVTLDLDGHTLSGKGNVGAGVTDGGIARKGTVVRNGTIRNFETGVDLRASFHSVVEQIRAFGNSGTGISAGKEGLVSGNVAADNGSFGIFSGFGNFGGNGGNGGTVTGNVTFRNAASGILVICPANVLGNTSTNNSLNGLGAPNLFLSGAGCNNTNNVAP